MKQLTLQEQYNLIKEGKGHKDVFLKTAKSQFPNIIPNAATFEQTSTLLKQRSIISENIWGVATGKNTQPDWFSIFNENVNENYVASSQEEPVKNSDKKISKQVEEDLESNFDYKDPKNRDNVYGQDFLVGYYAEMKDPKNSEKTVDELLELVSKNLAKDRLYYVKDGQFGVKGLGYTEDAPGLGAGKEPKGKYKSSGYGDLKENKDKGWDPKNDTPEIKKLMAIADDTSISPFKRDKARQKAYKLRQQINIKENNMIKLMNLLEREYYMPEIKTSKKKEEIKKKVKKSPIADRVKEIEEESMLNAMKGKIQAMAEEIEMRENKLAMIDENEDLQEFINPVRIKEMQKEIDELKKTKEKMEKEFEKKSKGKKAKEVIDEAENESGITIDGKQVKYSSIELENVDPQDRPDYADAYASYAEFEDGKKLNDDQLEELTTEYPDVINDIANGFNSLKETKDESGITIDGKQVKYSSIELENVDPRDRPDYVDAYASYAEFEDGKELTTFQLDKLTAEYPDVINDIANNK